MTHLRHTLDTVETVCSLVGEDRDDPASLPVTLWLTELMSREVLGGDGHPDTAVALEVAGGSAVVCLEVDEANQHSPIIQGKLEARPARARRCSGRCDIDARHATAIAVWVGGSGARARPRSPR